MTAAAPSQPVRPPRPLVLLLVLLTTASVAQTAPTTAPIAPEPYHPMLLAYGSADRYWIARVEPYQEGAESRCAPLSAARPCPPATGRISARSSATPSRSPRRRASSPSSWMTVPGNAAGDAGLATVRSFPAPAPSSPGPLRPATSTLSALSRAASKASPPAPSNPRRARSPLKPRRQPQPPTHATPSISTRPAPSARVAQAATHPTTRPVRPILLHFDHGQWVAVTELPPGAATAHLGLAVLGNKPLLATSTDGGTTVRTQVLVDGHWHDFGQIRTGQRPGRFDLLANGTLPALSTIDPDGAVQLSLKREGEDWTAAIPFALPPNLPETAQRTLRRRQDFRLVLLSQTETSLNVATTRADRPARIVVQLPTPKPTAPCHFWIVRWFVILGMVIVMLLTFYHRRGPLRSRSRRRTLTSEPLYSRPLAASIKPPNVDRHTRLSPCRSPRVPDRP